MRQGLLATPGGLLPLRSVPAVGASWHEPLKPVGNLHADGPDRNQELIMVEGSPIGWNLS